jgi:hypothetical protein
MARAGLKPTAATVAANQITPAGLLASPAELQQRLITLQDLVKKARRANCDMSPVQSHSFAPLHGTRVGLSFAR